MSKAMSAGSSLLILLVLLCSGCVERKLMIRSEPSGAQAWVDEEPVGKTPVEYSFAHYGRRRVRVGPLRDEKGLAQFLSTERIVELEGPWYETFPIDFFFEVLWPGTLVDRHEIELELKAASEQEQLYGVERARRIEQEAEEFRREALTPVPEEQQP